MRRPRHYSSSLTAVRLPEGHSADGLRAIILEKFNMSLGNGLGILKDRVFRIGHLGDFGDLQLIGTLGGVEMGLRAAGVPHRAGGAQAAVDTWRAMPDRRVCQTEATGTGRQRMIEVWTWPTPNGHKVHIALEELGLPYKVIPVNIGPGDQFKPEFLAITPNHRIPAIVDPDGPGGKPLTLFKSAAILSTCPRSAAAS